MPWLPLYFCRRSPCLPFTLQWLEHDLARVDRCQTPWLVVNMHRPM